MNIYLKEKIENPDLFTGRKKELEVFTKWVQSIPKGISKSTAILSRRKTGKTALMQRLYNLTFDTPDGVIPFYYEVRERKQWAGDFACEFFLTFLYQYMAYKTRNTQYLEGTVERTFPTAFDLVQKEGMDYLSGLLRGVQSLAQEKRIDRLWSTVIDTPRFVAASQNEYIVQMIDEFQYLNSEICQDEALKNVMTDFAGGYMSTAEYRNAPLLVSLNKEQFDQQHKFRFILPARLRMYSLEEEDVSQNRSRSVRAKSP